jgi:hypothetical protein
MLKVTNEGGKISIQKAGSTAFFGATTWERCTAQAASASTQQPPAPADQQLKKFRVTYVGIQPYRCHDLDCERNPRDFSDCATQKYKVNPEVGYFSEISNALKKSGEYTSTSSRTERPHLTAILTPDLHS